MAPHVKSKRKTLRQKYKIERKVKEHRRKLRKASKAKANVPARASKKKDPGIPNLWPYKQELMQEMERKRQVAREAKAALSRKVDPQSASSSQPGKEVMTALSEDAARRGNEFQNLMDANGIDDGANVGDGPEMTCAQLDERSRKVFMKDFRHVLEHSDVILEVLDARDPLGCRCFDAEKRALSSASGSKRIVLILNKVDLVPREAAEKWLAYLRNEFPTVAFRASVGSHSSRIGQSPVGALSAGWINTSECLGASNLMSLLKNYARSRNIKTCITVGVIGYPNVGKSSLVNSLKRSRAVTTSLTPGATRHAQEVALDKNIRLIDCPGIVFADQDADSLVLGNSVKLDRIADPTSPVELIMNRIGREALMAAYSLPGFSTVTEFLALVAKSRGKQKRGGAFDMKAAALVVLRDWNSGRIPFYTLPPRGPQHAHLSAAVIEQWSTEFDISKTFLDAESASLRSSRPGPSNLLVPAKQCQMLGAQEHPSANEQPTQSSEHRVSGDVVYGEHPTYHVDVISRAMDASCP